MPDILGFWDRRADDPGYCHTDYIGRAYYQYRGKLVTYDEREELREKDREQRKARLIKSKLMEIK